MSGDAGHTGAEQSSNASRRVFGRRFRTELCKSFIETGRCKYQNRCMYAHGEKMLRTEEENIADGLVSESSIRAWAREHKPEGPMRPRRGRGRHPAPAVPRQAPTVVVEVSTATLLPPHKTIPALPQPQQPTPKPASPPPPTSSSQRPSPPPPPSQPSSRSPLLSNAPLTPADMDAAAAQLARSTSTVRTAGGGWRRDPYALTAAMLATSSSSMRSSSDSD